MVIAAIKWVQPVVNVEKEKESQEILTRCVARKRSFSDADGVTSAKLASYVLLTSESL